MITEEDIEHLDKTAKYIIDMGKEKDISPINMIGILEYVKVFLINSLLVPDEGDE